VQKKEEKSTGELIYNLSLDSKTADTETGGDLLERKPRAAGPDLLRGCLGGGHLKAEGECVRSAKGTCIALR